MSVSAVNITNAATSMEVAIAARQLSMSVELGTSSHEMEAAIAARQLSMSVELGTSSHEMQLTLANGGAKPAYEGEYTIIPQVEAQTMETKDRVMTDNVLITAIPYYETGNVSGITVYIARTL